MNVSWEDSKAYVGWLSKITGKEYRLLSEAEWEYACRAGTETRYSCGDTMSKKDAHFGQIENASTKEVGLNKPNKWGLHDMHGNVWELVEDVWHENYDGAPCDGSAWTTGNDKRHVLRGGHRGVNPDGVRSAGRTNTGRIRTGCRGFRVARTL